MGITTQLATDLFQIQKLMVNDREQLKTLIIDFFAAIFAGYKQNKAFNKAIEKGGTTIKSFTSSEGVHGLFQNELLVHGKAGEKCPKCGTILEKTRIGGRGTHYCKKCQK